MPLLSTDPIDLLLGDDGDLALGPDGDLQLSSGVTGVAQAIRIALQMIRGEWFLDLDAGIPYLERDGVDATEALLGQKFDEIRTRQVFRAAILAVPNVLDVVALDVSFDPGTRALTMAWQASTAFGDTSPDTLTVGAS